MNDISPKDVFQTLRNIKLTQGGLKKIIKEVEVDGVIVVINGEMTILDLNFEKVKSEKDLDKRIIKAINTAKEAIQQEHAETLKTLSLH